MWGNLFCDCSIHNYSKISNTAKTANPERESRRVASRPRFGFHIVTCNVPPLKMATVDSEPFGKPTLLLGSSFSSDTNDTNTFTSNGLLDMGIFCGSGSGGDREDASSAQNAFATTLPDDTGPVDEDELSVFTSNGLLDGPAQMTSMVDLF